LGFFEKQVSAWKLRVPLRLLASALLILFAKLFGSIAVYNFLNVGSLGTFWVGNGSILGVQNQVLQSGNMLNAQWLHLYYGWDSTWYLSILTHGYAFSSQSYSFFPGFPLFGSLFNVALQNPAVSLAATSLIFGI
jgi:hypothetical protein